MLQAGEIVDADVRSDGSVALGIGGARRIIANCIGSNIQWAIVTSGTQEMSRLRLRLTGFAIPEVFVTVEHTQRGKPAPNPYLRAAELLQVSPELCTVFEDSPPGVASSKAAGMCVIALERTHDRAKLSAPDFIVRDFAEIEIVGRIR